MRPSPFQILVIGGIAAYVLSGCAGKTERADAGAEPPVVVVSIPPLEYFVERIGGDKVSVECLAPASADPETFEPSMAQLRKASKAGLLLTVGLLPFEEKVSEAISASNPDIRIEELYHSLDLIEGTHDHGHHEEDSEEEGHDGHHHDSHHHDSHGNYDPHIWTSLRNARTLARNTFDALVALSPADSLYFKARLDALDHRLDSLDRAISTRLAPAMGKTILVWHPSLSYFSRDYGLKQLAVGHEHKESSITGLKDRLDMARREKPLVFFYQREYDSRQAQSITETTGLEPVTIAPLSADIEQAVIKAAGAVAATLPNPPQDSTIR